MATNPLYEIYHILNRSILTEINIISEHGRQDKMNRGLGTMIPRKNMDQSWFQEEQTIFTP